MAGYSGTPLIAKLGLKPDMTVVVVNEPEGYRSWLGELPPGLRLVTEQEGAVAAAHLFVVERDVLVRLLTDFRTTLLPAGFLWVSWPKKSSKVATNVTEDVIRDVALPLGFVDIKVCAVSQVWSGLKLVIRKAERKG